MQGPWAMIQSATIHSHRRVRLPSVVKDRVMYNHEIRGPCVEWILDKKANAAIISSVRLESDRYINFGDSLAHHSNTITLKKSLLETICERSDNFHDINQLFPKNGTCVYIAPHQMIYEEPYTSYLLDSRRLFKMIDTDQTQEGSLSQIMRSSTC
jgi:hypothetical protein